MVLALVLFGVLHQLRQLHNAFVKQHKSDIEEFSCFDDFTKSSFASPELFQGEKPCVEDKLWRCEHRGSTASALVARMHGLFAGSVRVVDYRAFVENPQKFDFDVFGSCCSTM